MIETYLDWYKKVDISFLYFTTARILASVFNKCRIYFFDFAVKQTPLQSFKLILNDMLYTASQKYNLCNIVLFKFTAYKSL